MSVTNDHPHPFAPEASTNVPSLTLTSFDELPLLNSASHPSSTELHSALSFDQVLDSSFAQPILGDYGIDPRQLGLPVNFDQGFYNGDLDSTPIYTVTPTPMELDQSFQLGYEGDISDFDLGAVDFLTGFREDHQV